MKHLALPFAVKSSKFYLYIIPGIAMQLVPLHAATKDTIYFTPYKNNVFFNSYVRYEFDRYPKKGVGRYTR